MAENWIYRDINGDFGLNVSPAIIYDEDAVKGKMLNLFRCPRGSRLHKPTFGCNLSYLVHEPCDNTTARSIYSDLFDSLKEWLPEIELDMGRCSVLPKENKDGFLVTITYSVPRLKVNTSLSFSALNT